jgi:acyl-CoA synthetase (NDP forming)
MPSKNRQRYSWNAGGSIVQLKDIINPRSLAVMGATEIPGRLGNIMLRAIVDFGYGGRVFPVNPKYDTVLSLKCYHSIADATEENGQPIDLAYLALPEELAGEAINECLSAHVRTIAILSSSVKDISSDPAGERKLVERAVESGSIILGPNCLGIHSPSGGITYSSRLERKDGQVVFVSQSGSMSELFVLSMQERGIGVKSAVSTGNELMVSAEDIVSSAAADADVRVIAVYAEELRHPEQFVVTGSSLPAGVTLILYKAGTTSSGRKAALSHTGAIAGSYDAYRAIAKKANAVLVDSYGALVDAVVAAMAFDGRIGRRVGVISAPGGLCVTLSDALEKHSFELPELGAETAETLRDELKSGGSVRNPLDLTMAAISNLDLYRKAASVIGGAGSFDMLVLGAPTSYSTLPFVEKVREIRSEISLPLTVVWQGDDGPVREGTALLNGAGIPVFGSPEALASSMDAIERIASRKERRRLILRPFFGAHAGAGHMAASRRRWLTTEEIAELFSAYGIRNFLESRADSPHDAASKAKAAGFPAVIKLHSDRLIHKAASGGVRLFLNDGASVRKAYSEMQATAMQLKLSDAYVTVSRQIIGGTEFAAGIFRGPDDAAVLMFGLGGTLVEFSGRKSFALCPMSSFEALELIDECSLAPLFGARSGIRKAELARMLVALSKLAAGERGIVEMDVNPLIAAEGALYPADVRILVKE